MVESSETIRLPSIAYIDEHEDARDDFFTDAYQSGLFKEVHILAPETTLIRMVDKLLDLRIDAVVSDFQLTEAGPVDYNGEALVEAILARRAGFPCFIRTSFDDAALRAADDVNRVYSKNPKAATGGREQLLQRIALQIERHHTRLAEWQAELDDLLSIDRKALTAVQVDRILELDEAIEGNIALDDSVARQVKRNLLKDENLTIRHIELIDETERLIADMRRALHD
ncbi:hypothetical protein [Niveispirillum sp. KHB5.9]|uniref:hypothetical protein n=1 Tax=Niveispirillum sp. KHB5.9 TaxID=3400269 RepID=UPI003A890EC3